MSFCRSFLTSTVSAPQRRRKAAASKVRSPVRMAKFFVSSTMPASMASASQRRMSSLSQTSCNTSLRSSQTLEA